MITAQIRPGTSSSKMPNRRKTSSGLIFSNNKRLFTVSQAAKILGVSTKTLRRWDKKAVFSSKRTKGKQRRYTKSDLTILSKKIHQKKPQVSKLHSNRPNIHYHPNPSTTSTDFSPSSSLFPDALLLIQEDFVNSVKLLIRSSFALYSAVAFLLLLFLVISFLVTFVIFRVGAFVIRPLISLIVPISIIPLAASGFFIAIIFGSILFLLITSDLAFRSTKKGTFFLKDMLTDLAYGSKALSAIFRHLLFLKVERHTNKAIAPAERITKPLVALHLKHIQKKPLSEFHFLLLLFTTLFIFGQLAVVGR